MSEPYEMLERERRRSRRQRSVRAHTIGIRQIQPAVLADRPLYPEAAKRRLPMLRSECLDGPRPCPYISCSWHLFLDVTEAGSIKLNFPDLLDEDGTIHFDRMPRTCGKDVVDQGGARLEELGSYLNLTRERVRQYETKNRAVLAALLGGFVEDEKRVQKPKKFMKRRSTVAVLDGDRDPAEDEDSAA